MFQRMLLTQQKKLQALKKPFTFVPRNLKLWHYASRIYTAGYILEVLITQKSYIEYYGIYCSNMIMHIY